MQDAAQVSRKFSLLKLKITQIISAYMNVKRKKNSLRYERLHGHDLTSYQVHGRSMSNVVRTRLVRSSFFLTVFKNIDTGKGYF